MAKKPHHPRLLEVAVIELKPTLWEWRVYEGGYAIEGGLCDLARNRPD
jgi:hypothetical protein